MDSESVLQWITNAIQEGAVLQIIYLGGSNPGAIRYIAPIQLSSDGKRLWAFDVSSEGGPRKSFTIDKIVRPEDAGSLPPIPPKCRSFDEIEAAARALVEPKGWGVFRDGDKLSVHKRTVKGDRLLKNPSFVLEFSEMVSDGYDYWNPDTEELEDVQSVHKTDRPWRVDGRRFKSIERAAEAFLDELK